MRMFQAIMRVLVLLGLALEAKGHKLGAGAQNRVPEKDIVLAKLASLKSAGLWKDLRETAVQTLDDMPAGDIRAGVVWNALCSGLERGNDIASYDGYFEKYACGKFAGNVAFWASVEWEDVCANGVIIGNTFQRGFNRGNAGRRVICGERDRAQVLSRMSVLVGDAEHPRWNQLPVYLEPSVVTANSANAMTIRELFYYKLSRLLLDGRDSGSSFKLQVLTDFKELPDFEEEDERVSSVSRPPVNGEGAPVFYGMPASWEKAASDGERLRFAIERAMRSASSEPLRLWADFLCGQFDVLVMDGTLRKEYQMSEAMREQLYGLTDAETIAELVSGTQRIALPPEFNYIAMYKKAGAYDRLGEIYGARLQLEAAAASFEKAGAVDDVRQLRGNWGKADVRTVQLAGADVSIPYHFRNARTADLRFYRVDTTRALARLMDVSRWSRMENDSLMRMAEEIAEWRAAGIVAQKPEQVLTKKLSPLPHHWETSCELNLGKLPPGAWIVEIVPDGNEESCCRQVLWIADYALTLAHGQSVGGKARLFLNEPVSGRPVPNAKITICSFYDNGKYKRGRKYVVERKDTCCVTDDRGVGEVELNLLAPPENKRYAGRYIIAESSEGRLTFLNDVFFYLTDRREKAQAPRLFMITDKTVYKPGDSIGFTGYLRTAAYDGAQQVFSEKSVAVTLRDPQGRKVLTREVPVDASSQSFTFEAPLPADAPLGQWYAEVKGFSTGTRFVVEEYKKPEYVLKVLPPEKPVKAGAVVPVVIAADYYFGAPVPDAELTYRVYREETAAVRPFAFFWNWLYGDAYALCSVSCENRQDRHAAIGRVLVMEGLGRTNAQGRLEFRIDSAKDTAVYGERGFKYTIEAEVCDSTHRVVSGKGSVIAAVAPFYVDIYTPWGFAETGKRQQIQVAAKTADGRDVSGTGVLRIYRRALNASGIPERTGDALKTIPFVLGGTGKPEFILNAEGVYELDAEVTADTGETARETARIFVVGETRGAQLFGEYPMTISMDKPTYSPGDVARVLITCDSPGRTVYFFTRSERDAALQCMTLAGYSTMLSIPVTAADQPNFFVRAMSFQNGEMLALQNEIAVPPEKKVLNVSAEVAAKKVRPGAKLPLKVTVTGLDGKPVSGDMTIAVYDKSLEAIMPSAIPAIQPFFWDWLRHDELSFKQNAWSRFSQWRAQPGLQRNLELSFRLPFLAAEDHGRRKLYANMDFCLCVGAAPSDDDDAMPMANSMSRGVAADGIDMEAGTAGMGADGSALAALRTDFRDRAFWAGRLSVPESGEVSVEIPVPDNLTTWVVRAWSLTPDTRVGEARTEFIVSKNLVARLELPRFMVQGDTVHAVVSLDNMTAQEMPDVSLELQAPGLLASAWRQTACIPANGHASCEVPLSATAVGEAALRLTAVSGSESDGLELTLPVLVKGCDRQVNTCGRLDAQRPKASFTLEIPEARRPETTAFTLVLSPGAAKNMVELLPYLAADDSEDVFGRVSKCLPALAAKAALQRLGVAWSEVAPQKTARDTLYDEYMHRYIWNSNASASFTSGDVDRVVAKSLQNVQKMVNSDGGWGWFGAYGERSWPDTTATVLDALLELQSAKMPGIDENVVSRGVEWLQAYAKQRVADIKKKESRVSNTDCLVARVLARAEAVKKLGDEKGSMSVLSRVLSRESAHGAALKALCYEQRVDSLSPYGLAMLALSYSRGSDESRMLQANLEQFLKVDDEDGTAYLNIPTSCCYFWYGNENETLSAYLELLLREDGADATAQKVANYLVTNIRNSPWRNSCRSLAAAVRALARYVTVSGEGKPDFTVTVRVDGEPREFSFTAKTMWATPGPMLFVPSDKLKSGRHLVELEFSGTGALYWNGMLNYFSMEDHIEPAGLEMKIHRNYYRLVRDDDASAVLAGKGGRAVSESVLKYRRMPLKDGDAVEPGDLVEVELISTAKNDYDYVVLQDAMPAGFEYVEPVSGWRWSWGAPMYVEYKERGAKFYLRNMARGDSNAFYRIRAQLNGRVTALPAGGYGLYAPELKCNSGEHVFQTRQP